MAGLDPVAREEWIIMVKILERVVLATVVFLVGGLGLVPDPLHASVTQIASGFSSLGTPVSFSAELTIAGDTLTVELKNTSVGPTAIPADLLSSYYFDILSGSSRPVMTYVSAIGDVYLTDKDLLDALHTAGANLKAVNGLPGPQDRTWEYKTFDADLIPFLGFGVGTVGNSDISPNNFNGNIVDGMDYSIYVGDVTTHNLDNHLLVKGPVTFTFSGLTGFTEANIRTDLFAFGLGTAPDSLISPPGAPEPATMVLLALGGLALLRRKSGYGG
jgi:hypothetical protein